MLVLGGPYMKYNTVVFRDSTNQYYVGTNENGKITKINYLQIGNTKQRELDEMFKDVALNEFLIIEIDTDIADKRMLKFTPITVCTLTKSDSEEEIAPNLCELRHDKLVDMFNNLIPEKLLKVTI